MRAEILAIGSELLTPLRSDTNALYLSARLREIGVAVGARVTVADDASLLESAFKTALGRSDIVLATGGLGPTADDITREAAAAALGRGLERDVDLLEAIRLRFERAGRVMAPVNEKQADLIRGARALKNARGTAPGQFVEAGGRLLVLLPGPPSEMQPMFQEQVLPLLRGRAGQVVLRTRVLRIAAMPESEVEQLVAPLYTQSTNPRTTILGAPGQVELHLTAEAATDVEADARIEGLAAGMRERLAGRIYSEDGRDLAEVVAGLCVAKRLTLAVAESCTGGLVTARLTDVPGASRFLDRGVVAYSNRAKTEVLGIDGGLIETEGAVSEAVAVAMAAAVRRLAGTDLGLAITGIAGPDGGTSEKPVGLVYIALATESAVAVRRHRFPGERDRVRTQALMVSLETMRRALLGLDPL